MAKITRTPRAARGTTASASASPAKKEYTREFVGGAWLNFIRMTSAKDNPKADELISAFDELLAEMKEVGVIPSLRFKVDNQIPELVLTSKDAIDFMPRKNGPRSEKAPGWNASISTLA